jgi:hypothetical protein
MHPAGSDLGLKRGNGEHVDAERTLHLGLLVEMIEDYLGSHHASGQ